MNGCLLNVGTLTPGPTEITRTSQMILPLHLTDSWLIDSMDTSIYRIVAVLVQHYFVESLVGAAFYK